MCPGDGQMEGGGVFGAVGMISILPGVPPSQPKILTNLNKEVFF